MPPFERGIAPKPEKISVNRIADLFQSLVLGKRTAFIPYIMAGDPSLRKTRDLVLLLEDAGADIVELGVPFTDPLADGPTIQRAAERALKRGVTLKKVIDAVGLVRRTSGTPIVLMTYYNPLFKYGVQAFVRDAHNAGVDGLIIPDLPPDEAKGLIRWAAPRGMSTIFLLAPTSTDERIRLVSSVSTGFIYYVSLTGITGSQLKVDAALRGMIKKIRAVSQKPVAVGFGVKQPDEARAVARCADAVIVGSSIVRLISEQPERLRRYLHSLRRAIHGVV